MTVNITKNTKSNLTGSLSTSVKKRPTIYISETDPRNNPAYINSHPGQIIVLSESDYIKWLTKGNSSSSSSTSGPTPNDSEDPLNFANAVKDIAAPGKPSWNTSDITYGLSDSGAYENITITFDESVDDPKDGSFVYHVDYVVGTLTSTNTTSPTTNTKGTPVTGTGSTNKQTTSGQTSSTTTAPVKTITTVNHTSSFFAIEWNALPNTISYTVTVTGWDIPGQPSKTWTHAYVVASSGGTAPNSHYGVGTLNYGIYTFTLTAATGFSFTGTYSISVQANYSKASSTGVSHSVTI
jgi:hypothetical protein